MDHSNLFRVGYDAIHYLSNLGIKLSKELVISYSLNKLQFRYVIDLGSHSTRVSGIVRVLKSKIVNPLELTSVTNVEIYTLPDFEQMTEGIITKDGIKILVDIPRVLRTTKSEQVIVQFEKQITKEEMNVLVPFPHVLQNPIYPSKNILEVPIEITVDYANLWYKKFDSTRINGINRIFTLLFLSQNINELLPVKLKKLLDTLKRQKKLEPKDIVLIRKMDMIFKKFENDSNLANEFIRAISTDKPKNVQFCKIVGTTKDIEIHGIKLSLPSELSVHMTISLDGKELTLSAKLVIDWEVISSMISILSDEALEIIDTSYSVSG